MRRYVPIYIIRAYYFISWDDMTLSWFSPSIYFFFTHFPFQNPTARFEPSFRFFLKIGDIPSKYVHMHTYGKKLASMVTCVDIHTSHCSSITHYHFPIHIPLWWFLLGFILYFLLNTRNASVGTATILRWFIIFFFHEYNTRYTQ